MSSLHLVTTHVAKRRCTEEAPSSVYPMETKCKKS